MRLDFLFSRAHLSNISCSWVSLMPHFSVLRSSTVSCYSVTKSCLTFLQPHGLQHARLPCPSLSPRVCSNSCPLNRWCHPTTSSSITPFFSCRQSFPASGYFPMSQLSASGDQSRYLLIHYNTSYQPAPPQSNQSPHLPFLLPKSSGTPALWLATPPIPLTSSRNIPTTCYPNLAVFWAPSSLEHLSRRGWISFSTSLFQGQAVRRPWPWFPLLFPSHLLPLSKS